MKRFIIHTIVVALLLALFSELHWLSVSGGYAAMLAGSLLWALMYWIIHPLFKLLSLPLLIITFGLFIVVLYAGLLYTTSILIALVPSLGYTLVFPSVETFSYCAIVLSISMGILHTTFLRHT